jgi:probable FeS assembly SUF system protein SufT
MAPSEPIKLSRECPVLEIPSGVSSYLPAGMVVRIMQSLGGSYTIASQMGGMYRVDAKDADALGLSVLAAPEVAVPASQGGFSEESVWKQLKTIYDPEIPVNIVDLGLIYSCVSTRLGDVGYRIDVKMAMTAPGCGMANVLKAEVESKLAQIAEVRDVRVEIVFDPPWSQSRMSDAAKLQLGLDVDSGTDSSSLPIVK